MCWKPNCPGSVPAHATSIFKVVLDWKNFIRVNKKEKTFFNNPPGVVIKKKRRKPKCSRSIRACATWLLGFCRVKKLGRIEM